MDGHEQSKSADIVTLMELKTAFECEGGCSFKLGNYHRRRREDRMKTNHLTSKHLSVVWRTLPAVSSTETVS